MKTRSLCREADDIYGTVVNSEKPARPSRERSGEIYHVGDGEADNGTGVPDQEV